ncbi:MAG: hypothetical protein KC800_30335 [Candidatus Eremiobacteraeota bacterium]|nr:hypothetical protein [Candidatus Eremiobacteraeota bacterium]
MEDILETRTRELAQRGTRSDKVDKVSLLISEWSEERFGFEPSLFSRVLETEAAPCPTGVTYRTLPCSGFIYHHGQVYPVVSWSALLGIESPDRPVYAVTDRLGLALELAGPCRIEKLDGKKFKDVNRPYCKQKSGDLYIGDLGTLK